MLSSIVWFHMNNNNRNQEGTKREQRKQTDWTWFPSNALSVRAKRFSVVIQINKRLSRWNEMWCLHLFLRIWHSALCWDSHQEALRLLLLYERQQNDIHQHWNMRHETWDMRHETWDRLMWRSRWSKSTLMTSDSILQGIKTRHFILHSLGKSTGSTLTWICLSV